MNPESTPDSAPPLPGQGLRSDAYWQRMPGSTYESMIHHRESDGNHAYLQQEAFLSEFIAAEQRRAGRAIDVLEFGCGFGRHARYLVLLRDVQYHGYDFSQPMVEPLLKNPPPGLDRLADRIFIGADATSAVGGKRFDVVFTVSVLIHNPPERVRELLETMRGLLKPGGVVCLVENRLMPVCVYENDWHGGCWLHAYPELVGRGWDASLGQGSIDTHDVYVLRPTSEDSCRWKDLVADQTLSSQDLYLRGLPKLKEWAAANKPVPAHAKAELARSADLEEQLRVERSRYERRLRLVAVVEDLRTVRAQSTPPRAQPLPAATVAPRTETDGILVNHPFDTAWARQDVRLARVVHVFHQEWHGIRAAAGYAPGEKIAITATRPLKAREHRRALEVIGRELVRVAVFHGFSQNAEELARLLRKQLGSSVRLVAVWHGSTAQFAWGNEIGLFPRLLELQKKQIFDAVACVKPEMCSISEGIFPRTLLNLPPSIVVPTRPGFDGAVLIPLSGDWWKNFYTNLYAATGSTHVRSVRTIGHFRRVPELEGKAKVVVEPRLERSALFGRMGESDAALHATLSDCQPMAALECLGVGIPCVTAQLGLDEILDRHPYQQLVQVSTPDSVGKVRRTLDRVMGLKERSPKELNEMIADYRSSLSSAALDRYLDFLRL